jgi:hypothetical protein
MRLLSAIPGREARAFLADIVPLTSPVPLAPDLVLRSAG